MLDKFIYENHLGQRFVGLDFGVYLNSSELRNYSWKYDTINSAISRFYRPTTNRKIPLVVCGYTAEEAMAAMNRLVELAESDVVAKIPGKVIVGEYYTHGYITSSKKKNYLVDKHLCNIELIMTSDDPAWYREQIHPFIPTSGGDKPEPITAKFAEGTNLVINDSSDGVLSGLTLYGKTTQNGTPTPDSPVELESVGDDGIISVKIGVSESDENPQNMTIQTPNGLPGIPVSNGGNYTDENGQQWICDEVDFSRGKYVQRVKQYVFNGAEAWSTTITNTSGLYRFMVIRSGIENPISVAYKGKMMCNRYRVVTANATYSLTEAVSLQEWSGSTAIQFYNADYANGDIAAWKAYLAENPITCLFVLATPIETDLTAEELAQYSALHTNKPNTTIYNDNGAYMVVGYYPAVENIGGELGTGNDGIIIGGGTDYPYDYSYDYALSVKGRTVVCDSVESNSFRMCIYGEATNPSVVIGGHTYTINGTIGKGETLEIDSLKKTITLTTAFGTKINWFDKRGRTDYIFEPIPAGQNTVSWLGTFGFDLTVIEKRSEPKWT